MDYILKIFDYDPNLIDFKINPNSYIKVRVLKDILKEWETYPG
jgi:hypothetical protein